MTAIGTAAFALAVMHAAGDRAGAWWSIGAILSLSVTAGLLALWLRLPGYVFVSGLLLNAAGVVGWLAWEPRHLATLLQVNVLCLAVGSVVWSLLEAVHREGVPHWHADRRPFCFAHLGGRRRRGAAGGATPPLPWRRVCSACRTCHVDIARMDWIALGAAAVAVAVCLWNQNARFVLAGQYVLGLSAVAMALCASCPATAAVVLVGCDRSAGIRAGRRRARLAAAADETARPPAANSRSARAMAGGMVPAGSIALGRRLRRAGGVGLAGCRL